jgi:hypothetical protein
MPRRRDVEKHSPHNDAIASSAELLLDCLTPAAQIISGPRCFPACPALRHTAPTD